MFHSMVQDYDIMLSVENYAYLVDLLGCVGHLDEAEYFINNIPLKLDVGAWGSFLGACRIHCNIELGGRIA